MKFHHYYATTNFKIIKLANFENNNHNNNNNNNKDNHIPQRIGNDVINLMMVVHEAGENM